jgi:formylmethanofuran dehydrogenase subunit A
MTKFAVFAHGNYWGDFEADTAEEAIEIAASTHGTVDVGQDKASTEGMTAEAVAE